MSSESLALQQSDSDSEVVASRYQGSQPSKAVYALTATLLAVVGLGGAGWVFVPPRTRTGLSDVDALVSLHGWNTYIEPILTHSKGSCDRAALVGLDGSMWTSLDHAAALKLTQSEAAALAKAVKNEHNEQAMDQLTFEGVRYVFVRSIQDNMFVAVKKDHGGITFRKTEQAIVVAHTIDGGFQGDTNLAVESMGQYLSSGNMRRRLGGEEEDRQVIVLELAGTARVGLAGDDEPKSEQESAGAIEKGLVRDWDDAEKLLHSAFESIPDADPSKSSILLTETSLNPASKREKLTKMMFDTFKSPAMYLANNAALAMFAVGRKTGIILHIDEDITNAVPVYEGHALDYATTVMSAGSRTLTKLDTLFDETDESVGVHHMVFNSIMKSSLNIRKDLYANIILAGPGAQLPGAADRLKSEVSLLAPPGTRIKVVVSNTWIGGSIMGSLHTFQKFQITKQEYEKNGPTVVHYKCF